MADTKKIRITRGGVFNSQGQPVPVGSEHDVPVGFKGWQGKYVEVANTKGKTMEVATPEPEQDSELDQLRAEYEDRFGEKPHGRMKEETLREKLEQDDAE